MDTDRPDDFTLHALADGELDAARAAQVAAWLEQHPAEAARVMGWQAQRGQLHALGREWLDEPVPAPLLAALQPPPPRPRPRWGGLGTPRVQALAAALMLALGAGSGWWARGAWPGPATPAPQAAVPTFVQDAAIAHAVYTPEQRHPVEVAADQQAHLVQWLSRRLGAPLRAPDFSAQGFALVGGRLLPAGAGETAAGPARAQFMYQNGQGQRLTLYVSVLPPGVAGPTGFGHARAGDTRSFYWLDGRLGYALSGPAGQAGPVDLAALAQAAYHQLQP